MPSWSATTREQSHAEGRGIDESYAVLFEVVEMVGQRLIAQAIVTEVEHRLHHSLGRVVYDPTQVVDLQVRDTHVAHQSLVFQFHQCGQGLLCHLLQSSGQRGLELDVVDVYQVDVLHTQSLHTLAYAFLCPLAAVVPRVHAILAVAPHLGGEDVLVARNLSQSLSQHRLGLVVSVVRRNVDEVHTALNSRKHGLYGPTLVDIMKHASQRRSSEAQGRNHQSSLP